VGFSEGQQQTSTVSIRVRSALDRGNQPVKVVASPVGQELTLMLCALVVCFGSEADIDRVTADAS
jgi:hypothetical protein